jgi:hypothetical protein
VYQITCFVAFESLKVTIRELYYYGAACSRGPYEDSGGRRRRRRRRRGGCLQNIVDHNK